MPPSLRLATAVTLLAALGSCDMGRITVNTTAKVLERAQPSLKMESDYELARQAIPGALKTVEGFWVVNPENERLIAILTEGYCQYALGFVEDEWEIAQLTKDLPAAEYHNKRASNMFTRCLNYALRSLGSRWQKQLFADRDTVVKLIKSTDEKHRTPMMFAGMALGGIIQHNLDRMDLVSQQETVQLIMERVIALDMRNPPLPELRLLPYVALGMLHTARPPALGGNPQKAKRFFELALQVSAAKDGTDRYLLARTLMAYRVGKLTNDRAFFNDQLRRVLSTDPAVWPQQRLANEIAHRKARRYLTHEKELF